MHKDTNFDQQWRSKLVQVVRDMGDDPVWGIDHCLRVYRDARLLGGKRVNDDVIFAAALVHDVGMYPGYQTTEGDHVRISLDVAPDLLGQVGFPERMLQEVKEVIVGHMFYDQPRPLLSARIFHDADALDFMGSIGVARVFAMVGRHPWTPDFSTAIALLQRFTDELFASLATQEVELIARERRMQMKGFLNSLYVQMETKTPI